MAPNFTSPQFKHNAHVIEILQSGRNDGERFCDLRMPHFAFEFVMDVRHSLKKNQPEAGFWHETGPKLCWLSVAGLSPRCLQRAAPSPAPVRFASALRERSRGRWPGWLRRK